METTQSSHRKATAKPNLALSLLSYYEDYSDTIATDDAADLKRYFRLGGIESFSRSPLGGILENSERMSRGTRPCVRCGGYENKGTRTEVDALGNEVEVVDPTPDRGGCGFVPSQSKRNREVSRKQAEFLSLLDLEIGDVQGAADEPCPDCGCHGWVVTGKRRSGPLTARPTGSSIHGEPDGSGIGLDLLVLSVCGKRLRLAEVLFAGTTEVLAAFFESGCSISGAWHLTEAGKKMLKKKIFCETPTEFFERQITEQGEKPNQNRAAQFAAADTQASELLSAASRAWNAAVNHETEVDGQ
jgi:hypothetical protein